MPNNLSRVLFVGIRYRAVTVHPMLTKNVNLISVLL